MRRLTSLFAALLLGSAAGVVLTGAPAMAAGCAKGVGVTVVVGGSVSCDANGGGSATSNFKSAGHSLTYVQRQPGFVCQVDGAPSGSNCVNTPAADNYWGLFWSDGTSGTWKYASQGVGSLSVPTGGWVAFVFQNSETKKYPSMKPLAAAAPQPTAKPTKKPATKPTQTSRPKPGTTSKTPAPSATSSATPTPTASTATPTPTASTKTPEPSATPKVDEHEALPVTPEEAELAKASATKDDSGSGGLGWVAGGIGGLLLAGIGVTLWRRKAAGGQS